MPLWFPSVQGEIKHVLFYSCQLLSVLSFAAVLPVGIYNYLTHICFYDNLVQTRGELRLGSRHLQAGNPYNGSLSLKPVPSAYFEVSLTCFSTYAEHGRLWSSLSPLFTQTKGYEWPHQIASSGTVTNQPLATAQWSSVWITLMS